MARYPRLSSSNASSLHSTTAVSAYDLYQSCGNAKPGLRCCHLLPRSSMADSRGDAKIRDQAIRRPNLVAKGAACVIHRIPSIGFCFCLFRLLFAFLLQIVSSMPCSFVIPFASAQSVKSTLNLSRRDNSLITPHVAGTSTPDRSSHHSDMQMHVGASSI